MSNSSLSKKNSGTIEPIFEGYYRVHAFSERISPKIKILTRMKFELAYYDVTIKHTNLYTIGRLFC